MTLARKLDTPYARLSGGSGSKCSINEANRLARFGLTNASYVDQTTGQVKKKTVGDLDAEGKKVVRDFFGRPILVPVGESEAQKNKREGKTRKNLGAFIKFQDGYSNAVRKPITLAEFMKDL